MFVQCLCNHDTEVNETQQREFDELILIQEQNLNTFQVASFENSLLNQNITNDQLIQLIRQQQKKIEKEMLDQKEAYEQKLNGMQKVNNDMNESSVRISQSFNSTQLQSEIKEFEEQRIQLQVSKGQILQLQTELSQCKSDLKLKNENIEMLKQKMEQLKEDNAKQLTTNQILEKQIESTIAQLKDKQSTYELLQNNININKQLYETNEELNSQLDQQKQNYFSLKEELQQKNQTIDDNQKQFKSLEKIKLQLEEEKQNIIESLNDKIQQKDSKIDQILQEADLKEQQRQQEINQLKNNNLYLKSEMDDLIKVNNQLNEQNKMIQFQAKKEQVQNTQENKQPVEINVEEYKQNLETYVRENENLQQKVQELSKFQKLMLFKKENLFSQLGKNEDEVQKLKNEIKNLNEENFLLSQKKIENQKQKNEIQDLDKRLKSMQSERDNLKDAQTAQSNKIEKLEEKIKNVNKEKNQLKNNNDNLVLQIQQNYIEINNLKEQLSQLQIQYSEKEKVQTEQLSKVQQLLDDKFNQFIQQMQVQQQDISQQQKLQEIQKQKSIINNQMQEFQRDNQKLKQDNFSLEAELKQTKDEKLLYQEQNQMLIKHKQELEQKEKQYRQTILDLNLQIKKSEQNEQKYKGKIKNLKQNISKNQELIQQMTTQLQEKETQLKLYDYKKNHQEKCNFSCNQEEEILTLKNCNHQICKSHLFQYIQQQTCGYVITVQGEQGYQSQCPVNGCFRTIDENDVRRSFQNQEQFQSYFSLTFLRQSYLFNGKNSFKCYSCHKKGTFFQRKCPCESQKNVLCALCSLKLLQQNQWRCTFPQCQKQINVDQQSLLNQVGDIYQQMESNFGHELIFAEKVKQNQLALNQYVQKLRNSQRIQNSQKENQLKVEEQNVKCLKCNAIILKAFTLQLRCQHIICIQCILKIVNLHQGQMSQNQEVQIICPLQECQIYTLMQQKQIIEAQKNNPANLDKAQKQEQTSQAKDRQQQKQVDLNKPQLIQRILCKVCEQKVDNLKQYYKVVPLCQDCQKMLCVQCLQDKHIGRCRNQDLEYARKQSKLTKYLIYHLSKYHNKLSISNSLSLRNARFNPLKSKYNNHKASLSILNLVVRVQTKTL